PRRLLWQPNRELNLDAWQRRWMYEVVLREAIRTDELRTWLDGSTLRQLWPDLHLPHGVRRAWEDHHPELRTPPIGPRGRPARPRRASPGCWRAATVRRPGSACPRAAGCRSRTRCSAARWYASRRSR